MSDLVSEHIQDISLQLHQYSVSMQKSPQKVTEDFLVDGVGFANYFSEFFANGLSVLIHQDKINTLEFLQNKSVQQFFANNPKFALDIILLLGQKKQYLAIKSLAETVLSKHSNYLEFIVQKSLALLDLRYYNETDIFCREMLKKYPNDFTLNEVYARNAHRKDDWDEALSRWIMVVEKFPLAKNPMNQLAFVIDKVDNYEKQKNTYQLLIKSSDKNIARLAVAKLAELEGDYLKSARCYQGILIEDYNNQTALKGLMLAYISLKDTEALKNHILRTNLTDTPIGFKLGLSSFLSEMFLFNESEFLLDNLFSLTRGKDEAVLYRIAINDIYRSYGKENSFHYERGVNLLEKLVELFPNNQQYKVDLTNMYIGLGYNDKAMAMIDQIDPSFSHNYVPRFFAWQKYMKGDVSGAKADWQQIAKKQYGIAFKDVSDELVYLGNEPINITDSDIVLFTPARNEMLRMPSFLKHYRQLGVDKFVIIDNDSTDGSVEFLLKQNDVYLFHSTGSYAKSGHGIAWVNFLIKKYAGKNWVLHVDVDELLVYPNFENKKLSELCRYLDSKGQSVLPSFMLDMFSEKLDFQLNIKSGDDLLENTGYFYNDYMMLKTVNPPFLAPRGGIFSRLLGPKYLPLVKTPLIKSSEVLHLSSTHICTLSIISEITSALLHFKLVGDFKAKAKEEMQRKQHAGAGSNYKGYYDMMNNLPDDFAYTSLDKTVKYESSQQLVDLGLIHKPVDF